MASSRTRKMASATRRTSIAGVVLLLAYALYELLPSAGGPADVERDPAAEPAREQVVAPRQEADTPVLNAQHVKPIPDATAQETPSRAAAIRNGVLRVVIVEREYRVPVAADSRIADDLESLRTVSLEEVVDLAERAAGDSNGLRVRVLRHRSSRASAEERLLAALSEAGLGDDAVYMASELLD